MEIKDTGMFAGAFTIATIEMYYRSNSQYVGRCNVVGLTACVDTTKLPKQKNVHCQRLKFTSHKNVSEFLLFGSPV